MIMANMMKAWIAAVKVVHVVKFVEDEPVHTFRLNVVIKQIAS